MLGAAPINTARGEACGHFSSSSQGSSKREEGADRRLAERPMRVRERELTRERLVARSDQDVGQAEGEASRFEVS
jgi:hypothetical protein